MAEQLTEEEDKIIKKWAPVFQKCGNLSTNEDKVFLANTMEALRQKAVDTNAHDRILAPGDTINVVTPTGTNRLVIYYDDNGDFKVVRQHKDWVND